MKIRGRMLSALFAASLMLLAGTAGGALRADTHPATHQTLNESQSSLARQVQHRLLMLPWYGVFDNLQFQVHGSKVILHGQVVIERTKYDAASVVKSIKGITQVVNKIKVLPLSPMDNQIRREEFHAIYRQPQLFRYAEGPIPQIHIIVDHGHVTLDGYVANTGDRIAAGLAANRIPGVFSVTNNLRIA